MQLSAFLLFAVGLQASSATYSQTVSFTGKDVPLKTVFASLKNQTGYGVFFENGEAMLQSSAPVTLDLKNVSLELFLKVCLKDQPLDYTLEGKTIFIKKKEFPPPAIISSNTDPVFDLQGHVTDSLGNPLIGASVTVKGSKISAVTDKDGNFTLTGISPKSIILLSSIGYETREYKINGKSNIAIQMKVRVNQLRNVTVSVNTGYQQISRERFVGSSSSFDSSAYNRRTGMNIIDRLDGTVSGVFFSKKQGDAPLQIRGISTLTSARSNPLIILDDFPFSGDINSINANDVKDITVLKDAAAASIWGTRGGNGVIVITTKHGKFNQPLHISLTSNLTVSNKPELFRVPQMNSSDFIDVEQFLFSKGYYTTSIANQQLVVISPVVDILNKQKLGLISATDATAQINALRNVDVRNDYEKYVFRKGMAQQYYININGGSNLLSSNLSLGYDHNLSSTKGPGGLSRYTINATNTYRPLKMLEFNAGINFSEQVVKSDGLTYPIVPGGSAFSKSQLYPYAQFTDEHGDHLPVPYAYGRAFVDTAGRGLLQDWYYRPLDELNFANNTSNTLYALVNLGASLQITSWLKGEVKYQHTTQQVNTRNLQSAESFFSRNLINRFTQINNNTVTTIIPVGGILDVANSSISANNFRGQLNVNKSWNGKHQITALIAAELFDTKGTNNSNRFYGYDDNILTYTRNLDYTTSFPMYDRVGGNSQIPQSTAIGEGINNRFVSLLGNINYTFLNKYDLYFSGRRDGANIFGVNTNNKWKPLWSTGLSWDISKESFYSAEWIPSLRFRASLGYSGNVDNTGSGLPSIQYADPAYYTNLTTAVVGTPPNPDLRWEEVRMANIGADFNAFKNRFYGSIEWYQKKSTNLIAGTPVDPTTGVSLFIKNVAALKGNGIDITLNSKNTTGAFKWETGFGLGYNKTIVTKYYGGGFRAVDFIAYGFNPSEGHIAYGISSYRWAGLDPATGDPQGYLNKQVSKDYTSIFNDSIQNQVFKGSAVPMYAGYLSNSFSYKHITLSANITYRLSYYFRKPSINYSNLFASWSLAGTDDYTKRWQQSGDEKNTNVPSMTYPANNNRDLFFANSEVNVKKGDNIRLQDIRLAYYLNNGFFKSLRMKSIQLYIYANNLNIILWRAEKSKYDPDYPTSGFPPLRTLTGGLQIEF